MLLVECVIGKTVGMNMIKLGMFSYNFTYTIMKIVFKKSKQSFYSTKNSLVINLEGKLQKPFYFFKMSDAPYLACSLVG